MARWNVGPKNGIWKGGRSVASNGYVLIRLPEHPDADCRGYVYEHRLVAERKIGRRLRPGEQVHHVDCDKQNNVPENLEVVPSLRHHRFLHRTTGQAKRLPDEPNVQILCACGCGTVLWKYDASNRVRRYVSGHNSRKI